MLVTLSPIFVADTKIISSCNFEKFFGTLEPFSEAATGGVP